MRIDHVAATPMASQYTTTAKAARQEANREMDSIVISEDARTVSDWTKQFGRTFDVGYKGNALSTIANNEDGSRFPLRENGDMFNHAADTYMQIKSDIEAACGKDNDKLKLYMFALDNAFEGYVNKQTDLQSFRMMRNQEHYEKYKDVPKNGLAEGEYSKSPTQPIVAHKDFDAAEFSNNLAKTGEAFVKAFTQGAKNGSAAWESVNKVLGGMQTTSINNMSFNDIQIIMRGLSSGGLESAENIGGYWSDKHTSLANNTNLSDFMRNVFKGFDS